MAVGVFDMFTRTYNRYIGIEGEEEKDTPWVSFRHEGILNGYIIGR